jgi:hypothetical protein
LQRSGILPSCKANKKSKNKSPFLRRELAKLKNQLQNYDIEIGDLILVSAKKSWDWEGAKDPSACVVRVCSVSQDIIEGDALHTDGFVNPASSFSFDKNNFIKISI